MLPDVGSTLETALMSDYCPWDVMVWVLLVSLVSFISMCANTRYRCRKQQPDLTSGSLSHSFNFRDFANLLDFRESLYQRNRTFEVTREKFK